MPVTALTTSPTNGAEQLHNFHDVGDQDWIKFTAQAGRTYIIDVENTGSKADAVITLLTPVICRRRPTAIMPLVIRYGWSGMRPRTATTMSNCSN
ncbi:MAG: hypothetical protein R2867_33460 [Caldilineaceae bacterium]